MSDTSTVSVVSSPRHVGHAPAVEVQCGIAMPAFDTVARMDSILDRLRRAPGVTLTPLDADIDVDAAIRRVHSQAMVDFLATAWKEAPRPDSAEQMLFADTFAHTAIYAPHAAADKQAHEAGAIGRYCIDTITGIGPHTYDAATASVATALTSARLALDGARVTVGLCRPPGHHVSFDGFGGGCYLNNAAITAQWLRDQSAAKVAIVDLDFHHGNGTQAIFYERPDVFYTSLHGHPHRAYPYFTGHADERGAGLGAGTTLNIPFGPGITGEVYANLAEVAFGAAVESFKPDVIVVSLGFDTYRDDPAGDAALTTADYRTVGRLFQQSGVPVIALLEGGYAVDALGDNVHAWLSGAAALGSIQG